MKNIRFIAIFLSIGLLFFYNQAYCRNNSEIQVVPLIINGIYVKDIEIRQYKNNQMILPIKEIAKTLDIDFSYNQPYKKIVVNDTFICASNENVLYAKNEIIKDYFDDIFISAERLSKLLKTEIIANSLSFSVNIKTDKKLAILEGVIIPTGTSEDPLMSAQIIKEVKPEASFKNSILKSLNINGSLNFYNNEQGSTTNNYSNNIMRTQLKARCFKGDLKVINDFSANNQKLKISGIRMNLKKEIKNGNIEIIGLEPLEKNDLTLASGLVGVKSIKETPKQKTILYAGTTDYNAYMFKDYKNDITKKIVAGAMIEKKTNKKTDLNYGIVHDNIIGKVSQSNFYNQILSNISPSLLSFSTYKNFNNVAGDTIFTSAKYQYNDSLSFEPFLSVSHSFDNARNGINPNGSGFGGSFKSSFVKDNNKLCNKVYLYSPDFYFAGNTGFGACSQNLNDKFGIQNSLLHQNRFFSISAKADNYLADLDNRLKSGGIRVDDYSISGNIKLMPKLPINYSFIQRISTNNTGIFQLQNGSISTSKQLTSKLSTNGSYNFFGNQLDDTSTKNKSFTERYILGLNCRLPPKIGNISLENEITKIQNSSTSILNSCKLRGGYNLPKLGKIIPSVNVGMPYAGNLKGLDYNIALSYLFDSGQELRFGYSFNTQNAYLFDGIYIPSYARSAFMVNFIDNLSLYGGVKPLNIASDNFGFIKVSAFCDKNENGQFDKDEKIIPNVAIKMQTLSTRITTGKKGYYVSPAMNEGQYQVSIDKGNVLSFYSSETNNENFLAKVEKDKVTNVLIPVISTPGSIVGKVKILDDLGNDIIISDLPVSIYNQNGEEINYSSTDEEMNFNITGLKPGKYTVKISDEFLEAYCLVANTQDFEVNIPDICDDNFVVGDINMEFLQKDYI